MSHFNPLLLYTFTYRMFGSLSTWFYRYLYYGFSNAFILIFSMSFLGEFVHDKILVHFISTLICFMQKVKNWRLHFLLFNFLLLVWRSIFHEMCFFLLYRTIENCSLPLDLDNNAFFSFLQKLKVDAFTLQMKTVQKWFLTEDNFLFSFFTIISTIYMVFMFWVESILLQNLWKSRHRCKSRRTFFLQSWTS